MIKRSADLWVAWGIRNKRSIFFYDNKVIDLTDFAIIHPGGRKSLENYVYKDITQTLFKVYPHNKQATLQRLMKYVIGRVETELVMYVQENVSLNRDRSPKDQKKRVMFKSKETSKSLANIQSKQNVNVVTKQKEEVKAKGRSLTKKQSQLSTSRGKDGKKDRFDVSIKLIEGALQYVMEQKVKVNKKQKVSQDWFQLEVDNDQIQQNKKEIVLRAFAVKCKFNL